MKVYWFENPTVMVQDMNKILDEIENGIKTLEEHERKMGLGGNLATDRVDYFAPRDLRGRLTE